MNKNQLPSFKENKSSINERKNKEFKVSKLKLYTKIITFLLSFIFLFIDLNKNYKIYILKKLFTEKNIRPNNNKNCDNLDPIKLFNLRLENGPITICQYEKSKHICYQNDNGYYNNIFFEKNGVICKMENIVLDPSKSE